MRLSGNDIGDEGATIIADALLVNTTLTTINLARMSHSSFF